MSLAKRAKTKPARVLLVEDDASYTQTALALFHKLGLQAESAATVAAACNLLEDVAEGAHPAPHLMVLDLGLGQDSGFEVLRLWKSNPQLTAIPVVVWTGMKGIDLDLADLFGVAAVVEKLLGVQRLEREVKRVLAALPRPLSS